MIMIHLNQNDQGGDFAIHNKPMFLDIFRESHLGQILGLVKITGEGSF